jgi:hypothetical protein
MTNDSAPASALWSGSYTADSNGHGDGIGALSLNDDGTIARTGTAVIADSPSFIAVSRTAPVVYAALESAQEVRAYAVTGASTLEPLGDAWPAGPAVCHVTVDPLGRYLIATCWGDGTVHAYELDAAARCPPEVSPRDRQPVLCLVRTARCAPGRSRGRWSGCDRQATRRMRGLATGAERHLMLLSPRRPGARMDRWRAPSHARRRWRLPHPVRMHARCHRPSTSRSGSDQAGRRPRGKRRARPATRRRAAQASTRL